MEISKRYQISSEQYFDSISSQIMIDYEKNTGKDATSVEDWTGVSYVTRFGKDDKHSSVVEINQFIKPEIYEVYLHSTRGVQSKTYLIEDFENGCEVTYKEELINPGFMQKWNYKILYFFLKKSLKKRAADHLDYLYYRIKNKSKI